MAPASRAVAQAKLVSVTVASKSVQNIQHIMTHTLGFPRMDFEDRAQRGPYFGLFLQILVCPELTACKENVPQFANHTKRLSLHDRTRPFSGGTMNSSVGRLRTHFRQNIRFELPTRCVFFKRPVSILMLRLKSGTRL